MNDEEILEEDLLSDNAFGEDIISSDQINSLNDKLDRVEALLNEDITLRSVENTVSGNSVSDNSVSDNTVNYDQYIYDLLLDSSVKVEVVEEKSIFDKTLNEYNVIESIGVIGIFFVMCFIFVAFVEKYTLNGGDYMEIYQSIIDFFGIVPLSSSATLVDLLNLMIMLFVGVYLVAFFIRSLFLIVAIPEAKIWS